MRLFKINDGETWWVIAETDEDAVDQVRESMGMTRGEYLGEVGEEPDVMALRSHEVVEITMEDIPSAVYREIIESIPDGLSARIVMSGTAQQWCDGHGIGIIGSTLV
jgi:hypothetical protein